jgi:hypothetical protein
VCQRWYDAVADDFLWQNIHLALIGPCEQPLVNAADSDDQAETAAAEAPVADGRMWRHRCVEVALATRRYFGLELGQEAGLTFSDSVQRRCSMPAVRLLVRCACVLSSTLTHADALLSRALAS